MAGSRAAASVSLTIGVAFVTLLVAGGILAGPAILDCSHQAGGIGACLRAKVQDAGLLPDTLQSSSAPSVSLQTSPPPAETRPQGWLEANANEYETLITTGSAALMPPVGAVGAGGTLLPTRPLAGDVAVAAPAGIVAADGRPVQPPDLTAEVALAQPMGQLAASGTIAVRPDGVVVDLTARSDSIGATGTARPGTLDTSANVAVAAPTGHLTLNGLGTPNTSASGFADPTGSKGAASITGSITSAATQHGAVALEAEAEVPQAIPTPVTATPVLPALPVPKAIPKPTPPKAAAATPTKTGPKRVFRPDPRYPNVIGLPPPPPIAAANSSFATLELR